MQNLYWSRKVKSAMKNVDRAIASKGEASVLTEGYKTLQKVLDKASKEKVIHVNKANRLKSKYANKVSVQAQPTAASPKRTRKASTK